MFCQDLQSARELDSRSADGVVVRLLWRESDGWVGVTVDDSRNGEFFVVDVLEGESAKDVFLHPFAYVPRFLVVYERDVDGAAS